MRRASHSQRFRPSWASAPPLYLLLITFACLLLPQVTHLTAASPTPTPIDGPYIIDSWDTDDGLPQNTVTSITQTRDGYLWFGTHNGLVRFDGLNFTSLDEFNSPELNSSRIVTLFEDSLDQLWIGTETGGIAILRNGRLTNTGIGQNTFEGRLASACQHLNGAVWLYTADGQLWHYHNNRFSPFLHDSDQSSTARIIISDSSGTLWIGTDHRIAALSSQPDSGLLQAPVEANFPVHHLDLLLPSQLGGHWRLADGSIELWSSNQLQRHWGYYPWDETPITAACEDRHGNLIVGTRGKGVFWLGPPGVVTSLTTRHGLSHDSIRSLAFDHEGNLWIGTDAGLNRLKPRLFQVLNGSRSLMAQSASEDPLGNLWVAFQDHGLARWSNHSPHFFGPNQGIPNPDVASIFVDQNHQVWAGTRGDGLFLLQNHQFQPAPGSSLLHPTIFAIHQDRSGRLWVGTQGGLASLQDNQWSLLTTSHGLSSDVIRAIADDQHGQLWIGTGGGGLNRLHNGSFTSFHKQHGLPSEDVSSLYVDSNGALWIGTFGSGLARFHTNRWTLFTTHHGLASNSIGPMIEDDQHHLWIASNAGLMRVPLQSLSDFADGQSAFIQCRVYGKPDGLPTRECSLGSQPGACRSLDGHLWFPTVKGLVGVIPHLLHPNPHPPPVVIESILIDGQPQEPNPLRAVLSSAVTLPPGKERLQIHFTSLNLGAPDRARFLYRLENHDPDWIEAGPSRFALYSRLPPGQYLFHVKASNEDGVWNESGRTLAITVLPPVWRTWWFLTTSTLLLLTAIATTVHYLSTQKLQRQLERLRHTEALEKERSRIASDIHDQLGASLTQVALLTDLIETDKNDPNEVEYHARQISQTARDTTRTLDEIVWAVNPSNDTLDGLLNYVCKHTQEFLTVAGLRHRFDLPNVIPPLPLPPEVRHNVFLAFKEAITNVVRHASASTVHVRLQLHPQSFTLQIEDDGRGLAHLDPATARSRNGLRNMRKRLESIGGSCSITPAPSHGTIVQLTAPLSSLPHTYTHHQPCPSPSPS